MNNSKILNIVTICSVLLLTGCSFSKFNKKNSKDYYNNVACSVPENIVKDNVDIRKKPMKPLWTEDVVLDDYVQPSAENTYTVKRGDTIYGIARRLGLSARQMLDLNGMDNNSKLFVGQTIKLPVGPKINNKKSITLPATETVNYTVKRGDSLFKIAKIHFMTIDELKDLNCLLSDKIYVGQVLKVNDNGQQVSQKSTLNQSNKPYSAKTLSVDQDGLYTIQPNDTLGKISNHFGVSINALKEVNGISDPSKLQIGKKIIIPNQTTIANVSDIAKTEPVATEPVQLIAPNNITPSHQSEKNVISEPVDNRVDFSDFFENFDEIPVVEINN